MSQLTGFEQVRLILVYRSRLKMVLQENMAWTVPCARIDPAVRNGDPTTAAHACLCDWFGSSGGVIDLKQAHISQTGNYLFVAYINERNDRAVARLAHSSKGLATGWFNDVAIGRLLTTQPFTSPMASRILSKHRELVSCLMRTSPEP